MPDQEQLLPLDAPLAEAARRLQDGGVPPFYAGRNGPISRERSNVVRALLYPKPKLPTGKIECTTIPGPAGPMAVEIISPAEGPPEGTLVYFHGGGFMIGDLNSHRAHAIRLANRARVTVLNVDYRLSPEHPFPQGIDDAWASVQWAAANLERLGGTGKPLAVGGDSSGGNFAAVMAILCRDARIALAAQLLLYPVTHMGKDPNSDVRIAYLGNNFERDSQDFRASPVLGNLAGVAPAILAVGKHDFLFDDNQAFLAALRQARVPVTYREYPTLNHGFFGFTGISKASEIASDQICDDLRAVMGG